MPVSDIHELYNLHSETKQCCEAGFFFFFNYFLFYINGTVLLMVTLTTLFRAQAQFLIMLPCVLKEES